MLHYPAGCSKLQKSVTKLQSFKPVNLKSKSKHSRAFGIQHSRIFRIQHSGRMKKYKFKT